MAWVATAIIGAGAIGAGASIYGANRAADAQTSAANTAADTSRRAQDLSQANYQQTRGDLSPYREAGTAATGELQSRLPFLTSPITMDQATLEQTPGYKFTRDQGLKAVQNSAAARGLGVSGAALKGAATFATGLADQTYQTQFQLENTNRTNAYNRLMGLVDTGEKAAAQTGAIGSAAGTQAITAAGQQGGYAVGAGNAQAAAANATGSSISNAAGNIGGYLAYRGLYGGNDRSSGSPAGLPVQA